MTQEERKQRQSEPIGSGQDICVAIATPPGPSGLAVIRISGAGSAQLLDPIYQPLSKRFPAVSDMAGYTCSVGWIRSKETDVPIDQVVLTRFRAPHSFTGEDMIELSCHGGSAVKQALLDLLIQQGMRPAQPGEFTKRAFLNGKLDLLQAEAVIDLIQSQTARSAQNASALLEGRLSERMKEIRRALYQLLAAVELVLEYPEHDDADSVEKQLDDELGAIRTLLQEQIQSFKQGRVLSEGLTVVLAGRPNAGKSSLLNALTSSQRAIVTDVPGTTRDAIETWLDLDGLPVKLIDTAGVRNTQDPVEKLGVERTHTVLRSADLVLWLIAPPVDELKEDRDLMASVVTRQLIPLVSKDDLKESQDLQDALKALWPDQEILTCSAVTGEGLDQIRSLILQSYEELGIQKDADVLVTNSRHKACLEKALQALDHAKHILDVNMTWDLLSSQLRGALDALAELTGESVSDTLIDTLFSRFCVGK